MPNVTISVSDELKAEMDRLSEVSWSEVCRNAISHYIAQRKNPTPNIELDLRNSRLTADGFETGYPTLSIDLRIYNKMDSIITVDRILSNIAFFRQDQRFPIGVAYDLHKRIVGANSIGGATIHLPLPKEKIRELKDKFNSTFDCRINCTVYVEDFRNEYNREVKAKIPIDVWESVVSEALKTHQATRA